MSSAAEVIEKRLQYLEEHLEQENPVLLSIVQSFRKLDLVGYRMGLLERDQSFATQIPWWPLIAVLGTFSAGKSTFINHFLQYKMQRSGNQAVDDRFTVICFSKEETPHALPGVALDSDPRFPFYQISKDIEAVSAGEGDRVDAYLQLKSCPSEPLKGKILIDSPGFDADSQRTSTLRITDHIVHLADLVLVFFDARHPEPGAMQDTLRHLVKNTIERPDSGKFLYILNQIDTAAREDNPEDVIAAWQRALGEQGLTAGRFYTIYSPDAAVPINDPALRQRFESKRDADLGEIHGRMQQVEIERAYRIVASLNQTARDIEERAVPFLAEAIARWKTRVLWGDLFGLGLTGAALAWLATRMDLFNQPVSWLTYGFAAITAILFITVHYGIREVAARSLGASIGEKAAGIKMLGNLNAAFRRNTRPWRSIFKKVPAGWRRSSRKIVHQTIQDTDTYVQTLNDRYTNPSGTSAPQAAASEPEGQAEQQGEAKQPARESDASGD